MIDADRERLVRILGRLGSDHAGERAAAGLHAEAFRRKHRLTWEELLNGPPLKVAPAPPPEPEPTPPQEPISPIYSPPVRAPERWINWRELLLPASYVILVVAPLAISLLFRHFL